MTSTRKKPLRFATVLVNSRRARSEHVNLKRLSTLLEAAYRISISSWPALDGIILPEGYFYYNEHIASYDDETQLKLMRRSMFHDFAGEALEILHMQSPSAYIITGIHSAPLTPVESGETVCIAWNWSGLVGIGQKLLCHHREGGRSLLWTYRNELQEQKPLFSFHSRNAEWLGCYASPNAKESLPAELHSIAALPVTNDTGEALAIRLFEAKF